MEKQTVAVLGPGSGTALFASLASTAKAPVSWGNIQEQIDEVIPLIPNQRCFKDIAS